MPASHESATSATLTQRHACSRPYSTAACTDTNANMLTVRMDGRNSSCTADRIAMTSALPSGKRRRNAKGESIIIVSVIVSTRFGEYGALPIICKSPYVAESNSAISTIVAITSISAARSTAQIDPPSSTHAYLLGRVLWGAPDPSILVYAR